MKPNHAENFGPELTEAEIDAALQDDKIKTIGGLEARDINTAARLADVAEDIDEALRSTAEFIDSKAVNDIAGSLLEAMSKNPETVAPLADELFAIADESIKEKPGIAYDPTVADLRAGVAAKIMELGRKQGVAPEQIDQLVETVAGSKQWVEKVLADRAGTVRLPIVDVGRKN